MRASVTIVMPQRGYETVTAPTNAVPACAGSGARQPMKYGWQIHADLCHPEHGDKVQPDGRPSLRRNIHAAVRGRLRVRPSSHPVRLAGRRHRHDERGVHNERIRRDLRLQVRSGERAGLDDRRRLRPGFRLFANRFSSRSAAPRLAASAGWLNTGTLRFKDDYEPGYRLGVAYEIPDIALRGAVACTGRRSITRRAAEPATRSRSAPAGLWFFPTSGERHPSAISGTEGPESGIAPGWLAFGSVQMDGLECARQARLYYHRRGPFARR